MNQICPFKRYIVFRIGEIFRSRFSFNGDGNAEASPGMKSPQPFHLDLVNQATCYHAVWLRQYRLSQSFSFHREAWLGKAASSP
jgi:hypothetical protein